MPAEYPFDLTPVTPHIGAELYGIDLSAPASDRTAAALRAALARHGVLFFRDQDLCPGDQAALARVFGEPIINPHPKFGSVAGHPEVSVVINDADHPPDINVWHTDTTYYAAPTGVCVLHAVETPECGGDTLWSSMVAAAGTLSSPLRSWLATLKAEHRLPLDNVPPEQVRQVADVELLAVHPLIRWIPEIRKPSLFVNRVYTRRILGVSAAESDGLLGMLFAIAESPDFQVRFRWRPRSMAIWDNRLTQHYAAADYYPQRRVMHRVAVRGSAPLPLVAESS